MSAVKLIHAAVPLSGQRAWAFTVGAPYHVAHGLAVDAIVEAEQDDFQQNMFSRDWGIETRADLVAQLINLGLDGHRQRYGKTLRYHATLWRPQVASLREECRAAIREGGEDAADMAAALWRLDAVQANQHNIRSSPLLAFDAARAGMLTRAGVMLGWLTDDEAWRYLLAVAYDVQRTYSSWAEYGVDFVLSRNVWAGDDSRDVLDDVTSMLLSKKGSPWLELRWSLSLSAPEALQSVHENSPFWSLER